MLDHRKSLPEEYVLNFPGIQCILGKEIGRGSNAIVYQGYYPDAMDPKQIHRVLIKELFPLHKEGKIFRRDDGSICVEPEGMEIFQMHRQSFEAGNRAHLTLLETCPDQIGANLNTYPHNDTLYTILGVSGGESLDKVQKGPANSLKTCTKRMLAVLDALEIFHRNGLAHLDIAPDNIILLGNGDRERALLIDYNSSMTIGPANSRDSQVLSIKQGYTAPEIRSGQIQNISFASDMYSVTAVFYRLLTGTALTNFQMIRAAPPSVLECPGVKGETDTVKIWAQEILRRGLQTIPARRYQNTEQMRRDLQELIDRIDGIGITHWSLWEAGRRQVERMVRENPSLSFIRDSSKLFPSMISAEENVYTAEEYLLRTRNNCMLLAGGGMGKTTAILHLALSGNGRYSPKCPALMYVSLYGWQNGESTYIVNSILSGMRFHSDTQTYEDARKALADVLDRPLETGDNSIPVMLLLLDGLNEVTGDTKPLLDEIRALASMQGIQLVVASRQEEAALPFERLRLTELSEEAVKESLAKAGLLLPESRDMQQALRTPMMLSMYIQSCQMEGNQVRVGSSGELVKAYLTAMQNKAVRDLPDDTNRRWQVEAASEFVLPAIADEIHKKQRSMDDSELLPVVEKCYQLINGKLSRRFFPQWIGRTAAIRGNAGNAEEWYGIITHEILWKQLGFLMRDETGKYLISHQVIEEYLLNMNAENREKIRRYYQTRGVIAGICLCLLIVFSWFAYNEYLAPKPYDDMFAENVLTRALNAYVSAGKQYEELSDLTECAINSPELFDQQLYLYDKSIRFDGMSSEKSQQYLDAMLETGEVFSWSRKPIDAEACGQLLTLPYNREEEYALFESVLVYVMHDEFAARYYGQEYPGLLSELLEIDAEIASELYLIVCSPHTEGKFPDSPGAAASYDSLFASVTKQNRHLTGKDVKNAREQLIILNGERNIALTELNACGAFDAYALSSDQ